MREEKEPCINYVNTDYVATQNGTITYNGCNGNDGQMGCVGELAGPIKQKIREIRIEQLAYGFIVRVGCKSFAIETKEQLIKKLTQYINNPEETEKLWDSGKLFEDENR